MANSKTKTAPEQIEIFLVRVYTVAARSVAEQPRLLHRRLDGGEELYYNQAMVEPLIQCLIQQVPAQPTPEAFENSHFLCFRYSIQGLFFVLVY